MGVRIGITAGTAGMGSTGSAGASSAAPRRRFAESTAELADYEKAGAELITVPELYGFDAVSRLGYVAARPAARTSRPGSSSSTPAPPAAGDDRGQPGRPVRWPLRARHRHLRAAGHRGLPRRALRRADRPDPGGDRDLPPGLAARTADLRRAPLHGAAAAGRRHRPGQAAEAGRPPGPGPHPDHDRRDRPAERQARRRAGQRLAAALLHPGEGGRRVGPPAARGGRQTATPLSGPSTCTSASRWLSATTSTICTT